MNTYTTKLRTLHMKEESIRWENECERGETMIYLDNSATTQVDADVAQAACEMMTVCYGNPSSPYMLGRDALQKLTAARNQVAKVISAPTDRIFFTSGGTEANNLAVLGVMSKANMNGGLITTSVEHSSVLDSSRKVQQMGGEVTFVPPRDGRIQAEDIIKEVDENTRLVSVMAVNNETGEILPVREIAEGVKKKNPETLIHCDCVQAYGKLLFSLNDIPADLVTMSAHKIHAPKGCGAVYVREGILLEPLCYGGGQESRLRPGTENTSSIAAFGKAADKALINIRKNWAYVKQLKDYLTAEFSQMDEVVINSPEQSVPYVLNISVLPFTTEELLHEFRMEEIYLSGSSACEKGAKSHVIAAMGIDGQRSESVLRIGLCKNNTLEELKTFVTILKALCERRKGLKL